MFRKLMNSYNVNVKVIFGLPHACHNWLIEQVSGFKHPRQQIYINTIYFFLSNYLIVFGEYEYGTCIHHGISIRHSIHIRQVFVTIWIWLLKNLQGVPKKLVWFAMQLEKLYYKMSSSLRTAQDFWDTL